MDMCSRMTARLHIVLGDATGQDLIEYALLVGLISIVAVAALTTVGTTIRDVFWQFIASALGSV
jgi:Flp pilus assembly pilin Flp